MQNAGDPAAGTGLNRSAIIQRISLSQVTADVSAERNATGKVDVHVVVAAPAIINPNGMSFIHEKRSDQKHWVKRGKEGNSMILTASLGATNYRNRIPFANV